MTKQIITEKQLRCLLSVFLIGSMVVTCVSSIVKQDFWISMLISGVMIIPLLLVFTRILSLYPGENFFDIVIKIFGRIIGKIFCFLYVFFAVHIAALLLYVFSSFIRMLNMPETPEIATAALISLVAIMSVRNGAENIARMSRVAWVIILTTIILTFVIGLRIMDFNNFKPVMATDLKPLLSGAVTFCLFPLGEIVLCLPFFSYTEPNAKYRKIFIKGTILFTLITIVVDIRNVAILGFPAVSLFFFPSYEAASLLSVGEFFTRFEVIIGLNLLLAGLVKICVCLYTASTGLAKIMNISDHNHLFPDNAFECAGAVPILQRLSVLRLSLRSNLPHYHSDRGGSPDKGIKKRRFRWNPQIRLPNKSFLQ